VTVVVQPGLVETRGDRYLAETDRRDHPHLHRLASLSAAGIPVRAGSDAPYGPADPWTGIAAAVRRTTAAGAPFGRDEAVDAATALRLMTADPGARFDVGPWPSATRADLVVLDDDWDSLTRHPPVALTIIDGRVVHATIDGLT
jgi:predicted amidohydrolase YtcJ